ncbi:MAG: YeeE/YedE family protein [Alphaproteobacteria bacterium]|nr:YeeE/YedE family protein [Alphaproteobacteria bacterium]
MTEFTPISAVVGGVLIGLGAVMAMGLMGRIAGMSGIVAGTVFSSSAGEWSWRVAFLAGMVAAPTFYTLAMGHSPEFEMPGTTMLNIVSGLIVGVGVTFAAGCASGHGVCGLARLSPRSIVATSIFMAVAIATVFVTRHVIGG